MDNDHGMLEYWNAGILEKEASEMRNIK